MPTLAQSPVYDDGSNVTVHSTSISMTAGNWAVVAFTPFSTALPVVSVILQPTGQALVLRKYGATLGGMYIYESDAPIVGSPTSVEITMSGNQFCQRCIYELVDVDPINPHGAEWGLTTATSGTVAIPFAAPSDNELAIALLGNGAGATSSYGTGWTKDGNTTPSEFLSFGHYTDLGNAGGKSFNATYSGGPSWNSIGATYRDINAPKTKTYTDTFNRSNAGSLGTFSDASQAWINNYGDSIVSNRGRFTCVGGGNFSCADAQANCVTDSMYAEFDLVAYSNAGGYLNVNLVINHPNDDSSGVALTLSDTLLSIATNPLGITIASKAISSPVGKRLGIFQRRSTNTVGIYIDGVLELAVVDWSEPTGAGYRGIQISAVALNAGAYIEFDNLVYGDLPQIEQEGFRFFNDNGNESASTAAAAQDANVYIASGGKIRPRFLLNTTGDISATQFNLQYRKVDDSSPWIDVK